MRIRTAFSLMRIGLVLSLYHRRRDGLVEDKIALSIDEPAAAALL
jgi:hypothetical protein